MNFKLTTITLLIVWVAFGFINAGAQSVQVSPKITIDQGYLYFEVYVMSAEESIQLGNCVFEISFNEEKLAYVSKQVDMDGLWDESNSLDYYDTYSTSIGNRAIFRVLYKSGEGLAVPTAEAAGVGCMVFQLQGEFSDGDIQWVAPFCMLTDIHEEKLIVNLEM